jgi:DNA-binding transcriptional MerR regulator
MPIEDDNGWQVGRLAAATGVTVRALHHYEDVGLLVPSGRTEAGHRLYADADVRRLYRIMALREFGMSLAEIRAALDGGPTSGPSSRLTSGIWSGQSSAGRRCATGWPACATGSTTASRPRSR